MDASTTRRRAGRARDCGRRSARAPRSIWKPARGPRARSCTFKFGLIRWRSSLIDIRDVRVEDAEDIVAILNPIIAARCYTALDTPVTIEQERGFIRRFPARGIFLVALDTTLRRVVGFQDVSPFADFTHAFDHVGVIGTYVDLERRRQGIAARLFAATFDAARAR